MSKVLDNLRQLVENLEADYGISSPVPDKPLKLKEWMVDGDPPMTFKEWLKEETRLSSMPKKRKEPEVKSTEEEWKDLSK